MPRHIIMDPSATLRLNLIARTRRTLLKPNAALKGSSRKVLSLLNLGATANTTYQISPNDSSIQAQRRRFLSLL